MGFKMKGSAFKQGGIQGTSGHASALKNRYKKSWRDSESIDRNKDYHNSQHDKGLNHGEDWDMSKENDKWTKKEETEGGPKMKSPTKHMMPDKRREQIGDEPVNLHNRNYQTNLRTPEKHEADMHTRGGKGFGGPKMKSPLEQTSFIDKLKSAATAATSEDGLMAVNFGPAKFVDRYKREKKKYRDEDRKEKMKKQGYTLNQSY